MRTCLPLLFSFLPVSHLKPWFLEKVPTTGGTESPGGPKLQGLGFIPGAEQLH